MPDGKIRSAKNIAGSLGQGGLRSYLVNNEIGFTDNGSVISYMSGSFFYTGDNIRVGSSLSVASTSGLIGFQLNGTQFLAGLNPGPTPGLILTPAPATGKVTGSVAVKLTRRRTTTGGEGNAGPASPAVTGNQSKVRVTIPPADFGQNAWGLYATFTGFGLQGPFLFLRELLVGVDVPMGGGTLDIDWYNSDLSQILPPTNHFKPYQCLYVASLENIIIGFGGLGGSAIQPSIPGDPESYPQRTVLLTNPAEAIQLVITRPIENELIFATLNSVQSVIATGEGEAPILLRGKWGISGVQSRHGICPVESDLYMYSGQGIIRLPQGGEPDTTFAIDVQQYVTDLGINPADVVVGYDQRYQHVVYFLGASLLALVFNRQTGQWSPPLSLPGWAASAVTVQGILKVSMVVGGSTNLYNWESGSGGAYWLIHDWNDDPFGEQAMDPKTHLGIRAVLNAKGTATTIDVYANYDLTTPFLTITNPSQQLGTTLWDTSKAGYQYRQITSKISGTGAGHELTALTYDYNHEPGARFD